MSTKTCTGSDGIRIQPYVKCKARQPLYNGLVIRSMPKGRISPLPCRNFEACILTFIGVFPFSLRSHNDGVRYNLERRKIGRGNSLRRLIWKGEVEEEGVKGIV